MFYIHFIFCFLSAYFINLDASKPEGVKKVVIVGTCPDMCPEKERYGRIAKNCVSVLEMTSTFNPNVSLKYF